MILSAAQLQTIKADIAASSDLNVYPNNSDGNTAIANLYNLPAAPDFWGWRTRVTKAESVSGAGPDGTTFNWTGNGFITRTPGEQAAWTEMYDVDGAVNPSQPNVRQGFSDIFSGTGVAAANRSHMIGVSRRLLSRVEKLLAAGAGTALAPGTMGSEGPIRYQDIEAARNS